MLRTDSFAFSASDTLIRPKMCIRDRHNPIPLFIPAHCRRPSGCLCIPFIRVYTIPGAASNKNPGAFRPIIVGRFVIVVRSFPSVRWWICRGYREGIRCGHPPGPVSYTHLGPVLRADREAVTTAAKAAPNEDWDPLLLRLSQLPGAFGRLGTLRQYGEPDRKDRVNALRTEAKKRVKGCLLYTSRCV